MARLWLEVLRVTWVKVRWVRIRVWLGGLGLSLGALR